MKRSILSMMALLAVLGLSACQQEGGKSAQPAQKKQAEQPLKVEVAKVSLGTVPLTIVVPGAVVPDEQAQIASRLMGFVHNLKVKEGDHVKKGQLLFTIDPTDVKSQISQAEAAYRQARAALDDARADYERFKKLYEEESVSKQQFDKIRLQYQVAQQNLAAAKAAFDQARAQLKYANVKAPFDGVVVKKLAANGDLAAPGKPLLVLENLETMSVKTEVASDLYARLHAGDEATMWIEGIDHPVKGEIYALVSAADPRTRTHTVKISLPRALKNVNSGTFARVSFKVGERQTMMIPADAIVVRAGITGVFVVDADNRVHFRMIRPGKRMGDRVEVLAGLDLGERIVISPNNRLLRNGDRVEVVKVVDPSQPADKGA